MLNVAEGGGLYEEAIRPDDRGSLTDDAFVREMPLTLKTSSCGEP